MLLQANDYLWLYDTSASSSRSARVRPVGQHRQRRRPDPAQASAAASRASLAADHRPTGRSSARRRRARSGSTRPRRRRTSSGSTGCRRRRRWSARTCRCSRCVRSTEIEALLAEHAERPQRGAAQRALADEMTAMVHGRRGRGRRRGRRPALRVRSDDGVGAALRRWRRRSRRRASPRATSTTRSRSSSPPGLAPSNGDARRTLAQRAFYANGVQLEADARLGDHELLHGRYLLLRKGKRSHHLVEVFPDGGCASAGRGLALFFASRTVFTAGKAWHQRRQRALRSWSRCVPELRLLENGREDRTPVRAVRRPALGSVGSSCLSILLSATQPTATRIPADDDACVRLGHTARTRHHPGHSFRGRCAR